RLDALFLGDGVDLLQQRILHVSSQLPIPGYGMGGSRTAPTLKLHVQVSTLDSIERNPVRLSSFFEDHGAVLDSSNPSRERALPADRLRRHDLREPSGKPPVIPFVPEGAIQPRRRNLQRVALAEI